MQGRPQGIGAAEAVTIKPVGCLRLCGRGPLVALDRPAGASELYADLSAEQAPALLAAATGLGQGAALAKQRLDPSHPFFALQQAVVLEGCGVVNPESIDDAIAHGSYAQLKRVLAECSPEQVREQVRRSGLRGRGGAGYPTGLKWDTVALQSPGPRTLVCNADEGDPGAFMDRSVPESDPAKRNVFGLMAADPELARAGIRVRQFGQQVLELLGGRKIHSAWAVPGGVRTPLSAEARDWILERLPEAKVTVALALELFKGLLDGPLQREQGTFGDFDSLFMGLVAA
ncbi:MAG: hypothetical protein ACKOPS_00690, partial [Cyanobium sp.]